MRLQDDPRQKFAVIGYAEDAELQAARVIARQQKQRQLQAIIDLSVGLQARVLNLLPSIQFAKDLLIADRVPESYGIDSRKAARHDLCRVQL